MKVAVYQNAIGEIERVAEGFHPYSYSNNKWKFLGYEEIQLEKPKKTVVKEAEYLGASPFGSHKFYVPEDGKNPKCTYEVEE